MTDELKEKLKAIGIVKTDLETLFHRIPDKIWLKTDKKMTPKEVQFCLTKMSGKWVLELIIPDQQEREGSLIEIITHPKLDIALAKMLIILDQHKLL